MNRTLASALFVLLLPTTALAQTDLFASNSLRPAYATQPTDLLDAAEADDDAAASTAGAAEHAMLRVGGEYALSDGPLTVELLDGLGRPVQRLTTRAANTDALLLPAPALPAGTYAVRVRDAHGRELHHQRVVYRPR